MRGKAPFEKKGSRVAPAVGLGGVRGMVFFVGEHSCIYYNTLKFESPQAVYAAISTLHEPRSVVTSRAYFTAEFWSELEMSR